MALDPVEAALVTVALCGVLSGLAYVRNILSLDGTLAAFGVGLVIGIFGDVTWLLLLLFFLLSSFIATRYKFALKEAMGVQEGVKGERRASNVLANGVAPMAVAVVSAFDVGWMPRGLAGVVFVSALAVAGADTLASEIGVLSQKAYLITTFKRVPAGTDGGVSALGQLCAIGASLYTGVFGYFVLSYLSRTWSLGPTMPAEPSYLVIPVIVGFVGCQIDSVIGATLERGGYVNKKTTNLLATSLGAVLALAMLTILW